MFGGDCEHIKKPDGALFLDRDGEVSWVLKELHAPPHNHAGDKWSQCCTQVFKYVLQYLRAKRDSKAFSLPASLGADTAAAVAEEAVFLGLPELKMASTRPTGEYEYIWTTCNYIFTSSYQTWLGAGQHQSL